MNDILFGIILGLLVIGFGYTIFWLLFYPFPPTTKCTNPSIEDCRSCRTKQCKRRLHKHDRYAL